MTAVNPQQQVHDAIWAALESKADFCAAVAVGNRVKYSTTGSDPDLQNANTSRYPRVRVYPATGWEFGIGKNSSGSNVTMVWEIQLCTGKQNLGPYWAVTWAVYRAQSNWQQYLQQATSWNGKPFVMLARPVHSQTMEPSRPLGWQFDKKMNRGIRQWITTMTIYVDCWFTTSDIQGT